LPASNLFLLIYLLLLNKPNAVFHMFTNKVLIDYCFDLRFGVALYVCQQCSSKIVAERWKIQCISTLSMKRWVTRATNKRLNVARIAVSYFYWLFALSSVQPTVLGYRLSYPKWSRFDTMLASDRQIRTDGRTDGYHSIRLYRASIASCGKKPSRKTIVVPTFKTFLLRLFRVVMSCLSVCLSVHSHNSKTTRPNFIKFCMHVACGRGSVLFWRRCDMLCISGFTDDVIILSCH